MNTENFFNMYVPPNKVEKLFLEKITGDSLCLEDIVKIEKFNENIIKVEFDVGYGETGLQFIDLKHILSITFYYENI